MASANIARTPAIQNPQLNQHDDPQAISAEDKKNAEPRTQESTFSSAQPIKPKIAYLGLDIDVPLPQNPLVKPSPSPGPGGGPSSTGNGDIANITKKDDPGNALIRAATVWLLNLGMQLHKALDNGSNASGGKEGVDPHAGSTNGAGDPGASEFVVENGVVKLKSQLNRPTMGELFRELASQNFIDGATPDAVIDRIDRFFENSTDFFHELKRFGGYREWTGIDGEVLGMSNESERYSAPPSSAEYKSSDGRMRSKVRIDPDHGTVTLETSVTIPESEFTPQKVKIPKAVWDKLSDAQKDMFMLIMDHLMDARLEPKDLAYLKGLGIKIPNEYGHWIPLLGPWDPPDAYGNAKKPGDPFNVWMTFHFGRSPFEESTPGTVDPRRVDPFLRKRIRPTDVGRPVGIILKGEVSIEGPGLGPGLPSSRYSVTRDLDGNFVISKKVTLKLPKTGSSS